MAMDAASKSSSPAKPVKQKRPREDAPPPSSTPATFLEPTFDIPPPGAEPETTAFIHPDRRTAASGAPRSSTDDATMGEGEGEGEEPALSHKEKRMAKRRKLSGLEPLPAPATASAKAGILGGPTVGNTPSKSAHGIWVGNMNFSTSNKMLLGWFEERGLKEVTRINMPGGKRPGELNRGFAYLDFPTASDVEHAVSLSEQHLDGRKLLIKSSSDFTGRPSASSVTLPLTSTLDPSSLVQTSHENEAQSLNKTARKILDRQRNPAGPTLFIGNLGFETKVEDIREMFDAHQRAAGEWAKKVKVVKEVKGKKGKKEEKEQDEDSDEEGEKEEEEEEEEVDSDRNDDDEDEAHDTDDDDEETHLQEKKTKPSTSQIEADANSKSKKSKGPKEPRDLSQARDAGIRKIRLGTFEDTGKCKGWAFVDFHLPAQCTRALLNARNHTLDGRALVVEYASSEAVRRGQVGTKAALAAGGGRGTGARGGRGGAARGGASSGRGGGGGGGGKGKDWDDGDVRAYAGGAARKDYEDSYGAGAEEGGDGETVEKAPRGEFGFRPASSAPKGRGADRGATRGARGGRGGRGGAAAQEGARAKPGAALASAQRASEAIVESTGRKITFG